MARTRAAIPENESKADKFRRVANGRLSTILSQLDGIAKLATANYECTAEQADKIASVVGDKLNSVVAKLKGPKSGAAKREKVAIL